MLFSKFSADGLCDWGILLVIYLEFQGNTASTVFYDTATNKIPWLWIPPMGNSEKKAVFSLYCENKTATCYDRALFFNRNSRQEGFDKRKSLGKERGGVWGGEREPFWRKVPSPLPNAFLSLLPRRREPGGVAPAVQDALEIGEYLGVVENKGRQGFH